MEATITTNVTQNVTQKKGISGSTLKLIAIITMFIDHLGAAVLARYILASGYMDIANSGDIQLMMNWLQENAVLYYIYSAMRMIGRVAFPIFIFLMVEGFEKTRNRWKYALRMGAFALISEIPFDLTFSAEVLEFSYQNVFFTLFIGLLTMILVDAVSKLSWHKALKVIVDGIVIVCAAFVAELLKTDYAATGIICIMAIYLFRKNKIAQIIAGCIAFLWEVTAPLAFIPIAFYNGKRGLQLKYVFYLFYPLHLLVLYLICMVLGISSYPAI